MSAAAPPPEAQPATAMDAARFAALSGATPAQMADLDRFRAMLIERNAVMNLIGPANWWLPSGLDKILPHVSVDPSEDELRTQAA